MCLHHHGYVRANTISGNAITCIRSKSVCQAIERQTWRALTQLNGVNHASPSIAQKRDERDVLVALSERPCSHPIWLLKKNADGRGGM